MATLPKLLNRTGIDPDQTYVCIAGHVSKAGSFAAGQVYRGSHAGPQTVPLYWAPTGLADDELAELKVERGLADWLNR